MSQSRMEEKGFTLYTIDQVCPELIATETIQYLKKISHIKRLTFKLVYHLIEADCPNLTHKTNLLAIALTPLSIQEEQKRCATLVTTAMDMACKINAINDAIQDNDRIVLKKRSEAEDELIRLFINKKTIKKQTIQDYYSHILKNKKSKILLPDDMLENALKKQHDIESWFGTRTHNNEDIVFYKALAIFLLHSQQAYIIEEKIKTKACEIKNESIKQDIKNYILNRYQLIDAESKKLDIAAEEIGFHAKFTSSLDSEHSLQVLHSLHFPKIESQEDKSPLMIEMMEKKPSTETLMMTPTSTAPTTTPPPQSVPPVAVSLPPPLLLRKTSIFFSGKPFYILIFFLVGL